MTDGPKSTDGSKRWRLSANSIALAVSTLAAAAAAVLNVAQNWQDIRLRESAAERARLEIELRQIDQRHSIRMEYINLTTGEKSKDDVLRVLRYIEEVDGDGKVQKWARQEMAHVDREYQKLAQELGDERNKTQQLVVALKDAEQNQRQAEARALSEQLARQRERTARLEQAVSPLPETAAVPSAGKCEVVMGNKQILTEAFDLGGCDRRAGRECKRDGVADCRFRWNGGPLTAVTPG